MKHYKLFVDYSRRRQFKQLYLAQRFLTETIIFSDVETNSSKQIHIVTDAHLHEYTTLSA